MLPTVKTLRTSAIASVLALSLAVPAAPALAWGQREQDVLKGVVGTLVIGALINEATKSKPQPQVVYAPAKPYYGTPKPAHAQIDIYNSAAAQAFNSYSYHERQEIQRDLKRLGYYNGAIDGTFGPQTFRATAAYAKATGNLDRLATRNGAFVIYDTLV